MILSSRLFLKIAFVLGALVLLGTSIYVFAGTPQLGFQTPQPDNCPPPLWMWFIIAGLLLPWIPFLLLRRQVTVTFDNGIISRPYQQKYKKGEKVVAPEVFSNPGHYIEGWYRSEKYEEKQKWDFNDKVRKNMVLYAKWEPEGTPAELEKV